MKLSTTSIGIFSLLIVALSCSAALAWTPDWGPVSNPTTGYYYAGYAGNGYQSASTRSSWDYVQPPAYRATNSYALGTRNGYVGTHPDRTGPYLTAWGDTASTYPVAKYQDPVFRGAYDGATGQHYNAFTGYAQNQAPYQPTNIRAHSYPDPRYVTTEW